MCCSWGWERCTLASTSHRGTCTLLTVGIPRVFHSQFLCVCCCCCCFSPYLSATLSSSTLGNTECSEYQSYVIRSEFDLSRRFTFVMTKTKQTRLLKGDQTDTFSSPHLLLLLFFVDLITEQTCPPSTADENISLTGTSGANSTSKSNKPSAHRLSFVLLPPWMRRREGQKEKAS